MDTAYISPEVTGGGLNVSTTINHRDVDVSSIIGTDLAPYSARRCLVQLLIIWNTVFAVDKAVPRANCQLWVYSLDLNEGAHVG